MTPSFSSAHGVGKRVILIPGQGAPLTSLSKTLPQGCSHVGTCGPSGASAPPLAVGPSTVVHVPPPHIPPALAQIPPCPPVLFTGRGAEPQPPPLTLGHPCHCPCTLPTLVIVWGWREGQCWAAVTVTIRDRAIDTHLLSQFPIWDRDTAPSTVPWLCLCRLFGNLFSQIPSLSLILSTGRLVGGSSAPARLENPMGGGLCPP